MAKITMKGNKQFEALSDFISNAQMQAAYQPAMIKALLENGTIATRQTVARYLVQHDVAMLADYESMIDKLIGGVLIRRKVVSKEGAIYQLNDADQLTRDQKQALIALCEARISQFIVNHELHDEEPRTLKGSTRYNVLKRANMRCELCGCPNTVRMLHVDRINPGSKDGPDGIKSYQALCEKCHADKGSRHGEDSREKPAASDPTCRFCADPSLRRLAKNDGAFARADTFPVTPGHTLIIPHRHVASYGDLSPFEIEACHRLLNKIRKRLIKADPTIKGFNIGVNDGTTAGQTIPHVHMHLIPRRDGDVKNPQGGVRHLISGKGHYKKGTQVSNHELNHPLLT